MIANFGDPSHPEQAPDEGAAGGPGPGLAELPELPEVLVLQHGLEFDELDHRLGLAYMAAGLKHRACAFYLQDLDARKLHSLGGYPSTQAYAARRFGMSRAEVHDLLRAGWALRELPAIDDAFARGEVCWSKIRELAKVATPEHDRKWLDAAGELSINELCLEVKLSKKGDPPRRRDERKGLPEIRLRLDTELPPDIFAEWELLKKRLQAESGQPLAEWECVAAMIELARGALARDGESDPGEVVVVHAGPDDRENRPEPVSIETEDGPVPLDHVTAELLGCAGHYLARSGSSGRGRREVSAALRRQVLARDGGRCRCCGARRRLQAHHVIPWSLGGPTVLANLITLCRYCHALVHADLVRIVGKCAREWRMVDRRGREVNGAEVRYRELAGASTGQGMGRLVVQQGRVGPGSVKSSVTMCHTSTTPPIRFDDLVGQSRVIDSLRVAVRAATIRRAPVGHTLLTGSAGLGKTTIAMAIAGERGVALHRTTAIHVTGPPDIARLLQPVAPGDVVFIDEIHGLPRAAAEALYEIMDRRSFTLVGATTDPGQVPAPLLSRFEHRELLAFYDVEDLAELIRRAARRADVILDPDAAAAIATVSRGTPRRALRLLRRMGDTAVAAGCGTIDRAIVARTLERMGIDRDGLDRTDREYLRILGDRGPERPLGLVRLALLLGVDAATLERDHEPHLFRLGLVTTTPHGRVAIS